MHPFTNHPVLLFVLSFFCLWLSARVGLRFLRRRSPMDEDLRDDFSLVLGASLTLLGLIIGFSFSMATNRYDLRKNYEEAEANAIGTEYVRASFLEDADAAKVRALLKAYLDERIAFYKADDDVDIGPINKKTADFQAELWSAVAPSAAAKQTPIMGLVVSGMNDVLNSQGYTQSAWWNRIPTAAWALMGLTAIGCNVLVGYGSRGGKSAPRLLPILPALISFAFMLIADIDAPRHGIIRVLPQNLISLQQSLK